MKEIKTILLENPQAIENILHKLEFYKIKRNNYHKEITCGNSKDGKGFSIHVKLDETLLTSDFKYGVKGDFISFLIKKRKLEFKEVMNIIKNELGIENFEFIKRKENGLFGGIYSKIKKINKPQELILLDEKELIPFKNKFNSKFIKDGINLKTQEKFEIGFDVLTQRITIPWRDYEGSLIGIMGRFNGECDYSQRWLPIIPFPKRDLLYGYSYNYEHLQGCDVLYIGESEKFSQQLDSMEIYTGLSMGRSEISPYQVKKILSLEPKKIIFCLDEGLPLEIILKNIEITKKLSRYNGVEIGYIYDENNEILVKDSKASPSDSGKDVFFEIIKRKYKEVH